MSEKDEASAPVKNDYAYLQDQFRRQAQRRIDLTKQRFDHRRPDSHARMLGEANYLTIRQMKQMGVLDEFDRVNKNYTKAQADSIFEVYFNAYLDRAKKQDLGKKGPTLAADHAKPKG